MAVHKNSVSSVCKKEHRTFYAPFTRGKEQVYIYFVPTNIWKYKHFHESENLRQNSFTNDLHKN